MVYGAGPDLKGVGGWLLLLCLSLAVFDPSAVIVSLFVVTDAAKPYFPGHPEFFRLMLVSGVLRLAIAVFSLYAGVSLWRCLPNALTIARRYLLTVFAYSIVAPFLPIILRAGQYSSLEMLATTGLSSLLTIAYAAMWYIYLKRSRRVKATYGN
jgi:hypothetical protein